LLETVVTERALLGDVLVLAHVDDTERASGDAVPAAVAGRLVYVDGIELGTQDGAGGADVQARGVDAVLADVGHHQPGGLRAVGIGTELLDELHVPPVDVREAARVIVAVAAEQWQALAKTIRLRGPGAGGQTIPLVTGDLAGLAADAHGRVGVETYGVGHDLPPRGLGWC